MTPGYEVDCQVAERVFEYLVQRSKNPLEPATMGHMHGRMLRVPPYSTDKKWAMDVVFWMMNYPDKQRDAFFNAIDFIATDALPDGDTPNWMERMDPMKVCLSALKAVEVKP
jgi:hypothetical protein